MITSPVRVSPVKVIASTSGWLVTNSPAESGPEAVHHVVAHPSGMPASFITSPSSVAVAASPPRA